MDKQRNFLEGRQKAYQQVFENEVGKQVLEDLSKFCRAENSTFHPDARVSTLLQGRREVWIRIQQHLKMNSEELYTLLTEGKKHG